MNFRLVQRRTTWCPTRLGWIVLLALLGAPVLLWCFQGESFLSLTERQPADLLIVEGWIGIEGVRAAKIEFEKGQYRYLVTTGGLMTNHWGDERWILATEARLTLLRAGLPAEKVIEAPARETESHRTFGSALGVRLALEERELHVAAVNIFTRGAHARRSRLVYAKVLPPGIKVGVISWIPSTYQQGPWWRSSDRTDDLLKETVGYPFELLLNSGRRSNRVAGDRPRKP